MKALSVIISGVFIILENKNRDRPFRMMITVTWENSHYDK